MREFSLHAAASQRICLSDPASARLGVVRPEKVDGRFACVEVMV
ncbi:MAG TPA: hypothetical protein PK992_20230 [Planctomycetaceae bacterium]|nr:hypothetical protein [Planctomycetaceae bacterium]